MLDAAQVALALRAFHEVQIEMGMDPGAGQTLFPGLSETLERVANLPQDTLLLGVAGDGLPLLLHLRDPRPGPLLVTGERGCGKTDFLKVLLLSAERLCNTSSVRFVVLSDHPEEFAEMEAPGRLLGVLPAYESHSERFLYELACRAQYPDMDQPVLLLFDGLDSILHMSPGAQQNLAFLFKNGPQSMVWPVVSVNAEMALKLPAWLALFRTRIYGRITNPHTAEELTPIPGAGLDGLFPGSQFCLRQNSQWLKFWLPSLSA